MVRSGAVFRCCHGRIWEPLKPMNFIHEATARRDHSRGSSAYSNGPFEGLAPSIVSELAKQLVGLIVWVVSFWDRIRISPYDLVSARGNTRSIPGPRRGARPGHFQPRCSPQHPDQPVATATAAHHRNDRLSVAASPVGCRLRTIGPQGALERQEIFDMTLRNDDHRAVRPALLQQRHRRSWQRKLMVQEPRGVLNPFAPIPSSRLPRRGHPTLKVGAPSVPGGAQVCPRGPRWSCRDNPNGYAAGFNVGSGWRG